VLTLKAFTVKAYWVEECVMKIERTRQRLDI